MDPKFYFTIILCLFLSACGGGDEKEPKVAIPETPTGNSGLAPSSIANTIFEMTINNPPEEKITSDLPNTGKIIIHEFNKSNISYFQID